MEKDIKNIVEWDDHYNTGVDFIDSAHKKLFSAVTRLKYIMDEHNHEANKYACIEMIKFFKSYVIKHFDEEEEYMRSIDYKEYEHHKSLHDQFSESSLPEIEDSLLSSEYSLDSIQRFLGICIGWLTGHIMTEDRLYSKKIEGEIKECSFDEGIDMLCYVIEEMIKDTFNIDCLLLDAHYNNIKLNNPIIYELIYATASQHKLKITLCIEEKLVLQTVGKMPGIEFYELDEVVLSAAKELAKILMQRIKLMFKKQGGNYTFESDKLITLKDQKKLMKQQPPLFSMLFNTSLGHFVFIITEI